MASLERWEDVVKDLRADAKSALASADVIEADSGKDKNYGAKLGEARAFGIAADRITGEIEELRYA